MSNDVGLQKAILASLQSRPAAPRPVPAASRGSSFTSTFAPPARSSTAPRRTALPADGIGAARKGRVDSMAREGIAPTSVRSSAPLVRSSSDKTGWATQQGDTGSWIRRGGRGTISCSDGGRAGTIASESHPSNSLFSFDMHLDTDKLSSADYVLSVQLQASSTQSPPAGGGASPTSVQVLLDVRVWSPPHYVVLSARPGSKQWVWSLDRHFNGSSTQMAEHADRQFKPNAFQTVRVTVRGSSVSVTCDGRCVFSEIDVGTGSALTGGVGLAASRAKVQFRGFRLMDAQGSGGGGGVPISAPSPVRQSSVKSQAASQSIPPRVQAGGYTGGDDPKFVETIERDILDRKLSTQWKDIAKLDDAKRLLQEAVVLPLLMPELFTGIRQPWKGVLLFGPPGTGKTMLAKAVASEAQTTFFNVSAATLVSKYHGESEKLVRTLFSMARHYAPSTVFFDEIDSIMGQRGAQAEHEASRRLKGEMLSQMDGIGSETGQRGDGDAPALVMVLATTNKPWDLDEALRRRLEKRIYIPLPDRVGRQQQLALNLETVQCSSDVEMGAVADLTEGFSGADIHVLCREASMAPMRRMTAKHGAAEIVRLKQEGKLDLQVSMADILEAVKHTQPSVSAKDIQQYVKWEKEFANN